MKVFVVLLALTVAVVSAVSLKSETDEDGWFVPTVNGSFYWQSREQFEYALNYFGSTTLSVKYYLYTKSNPSSPKQLFVNDANALSSSNFNEANPTRFVIHGWQNNYQSDVNAVVHDALMKSGTYNVISVDWSSAAEDINYVIARNSVSAVGKDVATFIDFLNSKGSMPFNTLTLIGYSLGAHVSGFAGKQVTRGRVNVIIGLDPAFPLFTYSDCAARLCSTDASFVESIQTSGRLLGFQKPIGKASFYLNGGIYQPGCGLDPFGWCAHWRSYIYYGESLVQNNFNSVKCPNYEAAVAKKCGNSNSNVNMGSPASYGNSGLYYVPVNSRSLYGKG